MSEPREVEAKFKLTDDVRAQLSALQRVGRFSVSRRLNVEQDDLYFDTTSGTLRQSGATLRVRRTPTGAVMTFKGKRQPAEGGTSTHITDRLELEAPISAAFLARVSESQPLPEAPELVPLTRARELVEHDTLLPTARIHNQRTVIELRDPNGNVLELALDDCSGTRLADGHTVVFQEAELESKHGDPALLPVAAADLRRAVPTLLSSSETKLGRVMNWRT